MVDSYIAMLLPPGSYMEVNSLEIMRSGKSHSITKLHLEQYILPSAITVVYTMNGHLLLE